MGDPRISGGVGTGAAVGLAGAMDGPVQMKGDAGPAVSEVQNQLTQCGYPVAVDGQFGDETGAAVRDFQKGHGLKVDGIVGPATRPVLAAAAAAVVSHAAAPTSGHLDLNKELSSPDSRLSVAIGMAEGTRTRDGGHVRGAYEGHVDPGNGKHNMGTFSYQGKASSPAAADRAQLESLRQIKPKYEEACHKAGLDPSNPVLAGSVFDLYNQAPEAVTGKGGMLDKLKELGQKGLTPQNIAAARYQSFYDPDKRRMITSFHKSADGQTSADLKADQTRRTGEIFKALGGDAAAPATAAADLGPAPNTGLDQLKQLAQDKLNETLKPASPPATMSASQVKRALDLAVDGFAKACGASLGDVNKLKKELNGQVDQIFGGKTEPPQTHSPAGPGQLGYGSQSPQVKELKQALAAGGFYQGAINDKLGNDGIAALALAKQKLGIGGPSDLVGPDSIQKIKDYARWPQTKVPVDFVHQWDGTACQKASIQMIEHNGDPAHRAAVGDSRSDTQEVGTGLHDPAIQYMQKQLLAGKPVMIGLYHGHDAAGSREWVSNNPGTANGSENLFDIKHWVVATGTGQDVKGPYITFNDPNEPNASKGVEANNAQNRLYLDPSGRFTGHKDWAGDQTFELRGVFHNK